MEVMAHTCETCSRLLNGSVDDDQHRNGDRIASSSGDDACFVCLGLHTNEFRQRLASAVQTAVQPYARADATTHINRFSRKLSAPMINLPGDLVYRFQAASQEGSVRTKVSAQDFVQEMKRYANAELVRCLDDIEGSYNKNSNSSTFALKGYPSCVEDEELGCLACHVVVIPSPDVHRPLDVIPKPKGSRKGRRRNTHDDSQGGDPRHNIERRLERDGVILWTLNNALEDVNRRSIQPLTHTTIKSIALDFHVAIWRRPFYLKGMYTKIHRDVSQTPFHVVDDGTRHKLGATSVEEEITPAIVEACHGISCLNNDQAGQNRVFGMAKFHASGREDMDVRMLLPEQIDDVDVEGVSTEQKLTITGRPFVYEIFDAFVFPAMSALASIVMQVNHFTDHCTTPDPRSYGRNPAGVGISKDITFVPSASFKKLQEETEDKVKYYGCLCWSETLLPSTDIELMRLFGSFPLELQQRTPIRVLHRRSNVVRIRHVLSGRARRIDNHHFRLNISTSAGTYVKEFVHGDLGRTVPSVSTLLGCTTDILELDCEGIQY